MRSISEARFAGSCASTGSAEQVTLSWIDQHQSGKFVVTVDTSDLQRGLESVGPVSRNLTIGLIVAGQLTAIALALAVMLFSEVVSDDVAVLVTTVLLAFLGFSLLVIWRVSRFR